MKKSLNNIPARDGRALKAFCQHHPNCISTRQSGDHFIAQTKRGSVVFPDRDMGTGLWCKVKKMCVMIGLTALGFMLAVELLGS